METATANNGWVDSTQSSNPKILETARSIMENNIYCNLSTCSPDGYPWSSPVFFAYDRQWNIYWCSAVVSQHSQNIYQNQGRVAISIFNSNVREATGKGLYFSGLGMEVKESLLPFAIKLLFERAKKPMTMKTPEDLLNNSPRKMYQFQPQKAWITGERLPVDNHLIDIKISLNLDDIL